MINSEKKPRVLITGANGFVGSALCNSLLGSGSEINRAVRLARCSDEIAVGNIDAETDWQKALEHIDVVVHLAARVHMMNETVSDPLPEFRKVNVEGTAHLACQAAEAGVKRFIFISSVKVNGEITTAEKPFLPDDIAAPQDPYGISKFEAEQRLLQICKEKRLELVIIRPPLVYGPGVKGNFLSLLRSVTKGIPLPLGSIYNKRSLVAVDNLVDLIKTCVDHPAAMNQIFLVSDGEDLSTTELLQAIGKAVGRSARLIPFPASLLVLAATLMGKKAVAQRICSYLQVDISKTRKLLNWEPPVTMDESLRNMVKEL